jgi:hypothetical protein
MQTPVWVGCSIKLSALLMLVTCSLAECPTIVPQATQVLLVLLTSLPADKVWLMQAIDFQRSTAHTAAGSQCVKAGSGEQLFIQPVETAARHAAAGALLAWTLATGLRLVTVSTHEHGALHSLDAHRIHQLSAVAPRKLLC